MSAAILLPPAAEPLPRKHFTRHEVQQMVDAGLFAGQRFELIQGDLIDKMGQNPPHSIAIRLLLIWLGKVFDLDRLLMQLPVDVSEPDRDRNFPEPDFAILKEARVRRRQQPYGDEVTLLVEVADTTLRHDATTKRDLYARANVHEYWVVDIAGRRILVHRNPRNGIYTETFALAENETISIDLHPEVATAVSEILP